MRQKDSFRWTFWTKHFGAPNKDVTPSHTAAKTRRKVHIQIAVINTVVAAAIVAAVSLALSTPRKIDRSCSIVFLLADERYNDKHITKKNE